MKNIEQIIKGKQGLEYHYFKQTINGDFNSISIYPLNPNELSIEIRQGNLASFYYDNIYNPHDYIVEFTALIFEAKKKMNKRIANPYNTPIATKTRLCSEAIILDEKDGYVYRFSNRTPKGLFEKIFAYKFTENLIGVEISNGMEQYVYSQEYETLPPENSPDFLEYLVNAVSEAKQQLGHHLERIS